jgi:hypothetical protein
MRTIHLVVARRIDRPRYVWLAIAMQVFTGVLAIPIGLMLVVDQSGVSIGFPGGWIEATVFGSYLLPALYLLIFNGLGMLLAAGLALVRHWLAPWVNGTLAVGLIIWIVVQLLVMPEVMWLQWLFLAIGLALGVINVFWMRRTGQLLLW